MSVETNARMRQGPADKARPEIGDYPCLLAGEKAVSLWGVLSVRQTGCRLGDAPASHPDLGVASLLPPRHILFPPLAPGGEEVLQSQAAVATLQRPGLMLGAPHLVRRTCTRWSIRRGGRISADNRPTCSERAISAAECALRVHEVLNLPLPASSVLRDGRGERGGALGAGTQMRAR